MKATVYIPEDKAELYEKAKAELGGTISATFVRCLERELETKRAATDRIVVKIFNRDTERTEKKAFVGRWIVQDEEHWFDEQTTGVQGGGLYSVAVTKERRIVVVSGPKNDDFDTFAVHEDLDDLCASSTYSYPESLIAAVKNELGIDHIEELDI
jgi:hypothetical protein